MGTIAENMAEARRIIADACAEVGRDSASVRLLAATKMNDAARIREAIAVGADICGENRVQELTQKLSVNAYAGCDVHFIGRLQRNKVKAVVGRVSLIHSVDSEALLREIDRRAEALGIVQDVLIEVNIAGEVTKGGVPADELGALLSAAGAYPRAHVAGLMTIPPIAAEKGKNLDYFRRMHELFVDIRSKKYDNVSIAELSMGMSGDFADAVRCGATIVRLGTALFGARNYND